MERHLRAFACLQILVGAISAVVWIVFLSANLSKFAALGRNEIALLGFAGAAAVFCMSTGIALLKRKPWARTAALLICAIEVIRFPIGTAIGVYGMWILLSQKGAALFQRMHKVG